MTDELNRAVDAFPWTNIGGLTFGVFMAVVLLVLFSPNPRA